MTDLIIDARTGTMQSAPTAPMPPRPLTAEGREALRRAFYERLDAATARIREAYPDAERESWDQQASEAEALLADPAAPAPFLRALAAAEGMDPVAYAQMVKGRREAYAQAAAALIVARRAGDRALDAAGTWEDAEAALAQVAAGFEAAMASVAP